MNRSDAEKWFIAWIVFFGLIAGLRGCGSERRVLSPEEIRDQHDREDTRRPPYLVVLPKF